MTIRMLKNSYEFFQGEMYDVPMPLARKLADEGLCVLLEPIPQGTPTVEAAADLPAAEIPKQEYAAHSGRKK